MAQEDYTHGWKPGKEYRQDRGGVSGLSGPFEAEVMSVVDPTHNGRIEVWIEAFGDENAKDDPSSWITAQYLSPYYGVTPHGVLDDEAAEPSVEKGNGHAYGMWANVPDPGVRVLVVFSSGQRNKCYYIGFIPEPQMNQMVPAIGAKELDGVIYSNNPDAEEKCAHASRLPVVEQDRKTESIKKNDFGTIQRPVHNVVAAQMWKQGTLADTIRGPITSSAQRESPSYVFGLSTPGRPVNASGGFTTDPSDTVVGRRGGHTFVMDDGNVDGENNMVRIRTSGGHQITMSDDGGTIYVQHANGLAWIEMGSEGTLDGWAANSINLRTGGDINLHADKQININASEKINMYSKNITIESEEALTLTGKKDLTAYSKTKVGIKSDGSLHTDASGSASFKSGGHTEVKGATIGLNDGGAASVTAPKAQTQTEYPDVKLDSTVGWDFGGLTFKSIVTRAPTHEPWDGHNSGISDVKPPGE